MGNTALMLSVSLAVVTVIAIVAGLSSSSTEPTQQQQDYIMEEYQILNEKHSNLMDMATKVVGTPQSYEPSYPTYYEPLSIPVSNSVQTQIEGLIKLQGEAGTTTADWIVYERTINNIIRSAGIQP